MTLLRMLNLVFIVSFNVVCSVWSVLSSRDIQRQVILLLAFQDASSLGRGEQLSIPRVSYRGPVPREPNIP